MTVINEDTPPLTRAQNRFLRRTFNGRTIPIVTDGRHLATYKDAGRYLLSLDFLAREQAYAEIKEQAKLSRRAVDPTA